MPNIKPISDLRNYSEVLRDVAVGAPVFLTKNGRGRYAIVDMQDYEKTQATLKLMNELAKGRTFYNFVRLEEWKSKINKWLYDYISSHALTRGKVLAAYSRPNRRGYFGVEGSC